MQVYSQMTITELIYCKKKVQKYQIYGWDFHVNKNKFFNKVILYTWIRWVFDKRIGLGTQLRVGEAREVKSFNKVNFIPFLLIQIEGRGGSWGYEHLVMLTFIT